MGFSKRLLTLAVLATAVLLAQSKSVAHLHPPAQVAVAVHGAAGAALAISIDPGFHIQSNHPKLDYLIPSAISITPANGLKVGAVTWPAAVEHKFSFSPDALAVFEGTINVEVRIEAGAAAPGRYTLSGVFHSQACNDQMCRPPVSEPFNLVVVVK